jgi:anti-anti-sigma factor
LVQAARESEGSESTLKIGVHLALNIRVTENRPFSRIVHLEGRLNNDTVASLDEPLSKIVDSPATVVVFDLARLEYISSLGLRSILRIQRVMAERSGKALLVNPQPQVQKVLEIINAVDLSAVFTSIQELDDYLDLMQRRIIDGEETD